MRQPDLVIDVGNARQHEIPSAPLKKVSWLSRSVGVVATILIHLLLSTPVLLGIAAHESRAPDGLGSVTWASRGEQPEAMMLLDLSTMALQEFDTPAPMIDAQGIVFEDLVAALVTAEPRPPAELNPEAFEEADVSNEVQGDPAGSAALFGQYMNQVALRIERAWMRPRSPVENGRFECRVRIHQDRDGSVIAIEFDKCDSDSIWRRSLSSAIQRASPLSAPPEPWLFTPTLSMKFSGEQYVASRTREHDYEPATPNMHVAAAPASSLSPKASSASVMPTSGDVELTIIGNDVNWKPTEATDAVRR